MKTDHHYVPVFYLLPWCGEDGKLSVCRRLPTGAIEQRRRSPRSVAKRRDLYAQRATVRVSTDSSRGLFGDGVDLIEDAYNTVIENPAASIRDKLLNGTPPSALSGKERDSWAEFVTTLEHRSPRGIEKTSEDLRATEAELSEELRARLRGNPTRREIIRDIDIQAIAHNAVRAIPLKYRTQLAAPLRAATWATISVDTGHAFITADYPLGHLESDGTRIATVLPLSPSRLFFASGLGLEGLAQIVHQIVLLTNPLLVQQAPNLLFSDAPLQDGPFFKLLTAAGDLLPHASVSS